MIDPPQPKVEVAPDTFRTKMPRFVSVSPDGKRVVFESLGKLYVKQLPDGAPARLTQTRGQEMELFPSWSRDGQRLVYVEWTDAGLGRIRVVNANGSGGRVVTTAPGHYRRPRFSPDGQTIVFEKGSGGYLLSDLRSDDPGVYRIPSAGGAMTKVTDDGAFPHFGAGNDRIFLTRSEKEEGVLVSVDLNGEAERTHAKGDMVAGYDVSPDGRHIGFRDNYAAYVMPLAAGPAGDRRGQGRIGHAGGEGQRGRGDLSVVDGWRTAAELEPWADALFGQCRCDDADGADEGRGEAVVQAARDWR